MLHTYYIYIYIYILFFGFFFYNIFSLNLLKFFLVVTNIIIVEKLVFKSVVQVGLLGKDTKEKKRLSSTYITCIFVMSFSFIKLFIFYLKAIKTHFNGLNITKACPGGCLFCES